MRILVEMRDASLSAYATRLDQIASGRGRAFLAQALNQSGEGIRSKTVAAEAGEIGAPNGEVEG